MMDWSPILLSLELAFFTAIILFVVAVPLAYWLAYSNSKWKVLVESLISLPIVLPPTVIGFYLLLLFSPESGVGAWLEHTLGIQLVFSFPGLIVASTIYSLPFMVQPLQAGFSSLPSLYRTASYVLGKSRFTTLIRVLLPNIQPAIFTGLVLSFAHTIGEFGVVLMIGGNIPSVTRVASIAIYDEVESLNYNSAHQYSIVLFALCFGILVVLNVLNKGSFFKFFKK